MGNFRFLTAGESHGPGLTVILEGIPAGLELAPRRYKRYVGPPSTRLRRGRADDD